MILHRTFFILVLTLVGNILAEYPMVEPPRQAGTLRCSQVLTLKDIFDAGLRPYRVVTDTCVVGKSEITLLLPSTQKSLIINVTNISFDISKYDTVMRIDIRRQADSVEDAGHTLREIMSAAGITPEGLDETLLRATRKNPHWEQVWTQDWENEWLKIHIGFKPYETFLDDAAKGYRGMDADVVLTLEWKQKEKGFIFRTKPIMPPKGYEHVSMDIPNSDLVKAAQISDSPALAHLRYPEEAQRKAILNAKPIPTPNMEVLKSPSTQKPVSIVPVPAPNQSWAWLMWLLVVFTALVVVWRLLKMPVH